MSISHSVGLTSRWIAAARAVESQRPEPLFVDPLAAALAGPEGFALLERMAAHRPPRVSAQTENPYLAIRTRFIDDWLLARLVPQTQVVMLAAGLDTRAFRLDWPAGCRLFELDQAEVLDYKQAILAAAGARPRCERRLLALDLRRPFADALLAAGFDSRQPSCWLIEGLFPYLEQPAVESILRQCAELALPGDGLFADLPGASFFASPWTAPVLRELEAIGAPWKFGTDLPETLFAACGWQAKALRPGDPGAEYGRWPFAMPPRGTPGVPQSFYVVACRVQAGMLE